MAAMRFLPITLACAFLTLLAPALVQASEVLVAAIDGPITAADLELVREAIAQAEGMGAEAIVFTLDTPGGGLQETLDIASAFDQAKVPVIAYVYPENAAAWSAGTFILMSADVAAMAPYSVIGSTQPVQSGPEGTEFINESKIINAIVKKFEEKARQRGRNVTVVQEFVKRNLNLNPEEALASGVIEIVADDVDGLLAQADGLSVKGRTLAVSGASVAAFAPSLRVQALGIISDPMLASILMLLGVYAIIFGLSSPGLGSEIAGVMLIALALLGLGFNINYTAMFLIVFGIALLLFELHSPGFGVFGIAGMASIILGSVFIVPLSYPNYYVEPGFAQSVILAVIVPSLIIAGFFLFVLF
ncbi:MAG: nodulation protein NfeD, partial [Candidatus Aenigmarchaeota archaeon]|nr:nodulation protein NfeD [Candidatus Aenigmarchaeota archaeon]